MKHIVTCFLFFLTALTCNVSAGQLSEIELVDGGIILGEIISHSHGNYIVRSNSLGTVKINESQIRVIHLTSGSSAEKEIVNSPGQSVSPDIQNLQTSMMNNKEVMGLVMSLQNDPEMQALLKDPDIMAAVQSGDISSLMSNPKFVKLLNNAKIKEIQEKVLSQDPNTK